MRRMSLVSNATSATEVSRQLSFLDTLAEPASAECAQPRAAGPAGWHQTAHSAGAFGPTPTASTIDKTPARNTEILACLKGKRRAIRAVSHNRELLSFLVCPRVRRRWDRGFFPTGVKNPAGTALTTRAQDPLLALFAQPPCGTVITMAPAAVDGNAS